MITSKSFEGTIEEYISREEFDFVTFDLETHDSKNLNIWNAEIISYGLCFTQKQHVGERIIPIFALFGEILENLSEEHVLLRNILQVFSLLKGIEITGHNFQLNLPCKRGWRDPHGYDCRKIQDRALRFRLDTSMLTGLRCYDTINVAFFHYDHNFKPRLQKDGRPKKLLSSEEIEEDFKICRPDSIPKLSARIRSVFDDVKNDQRFSQILKHNYVDTIVEAIIALIFKDQMDTKNVISPQDPHDILKSPINIDDLDIFPFIDALYVEKKR